MAVLIGLVVPACFLIFTGLGRALFESEAMRSAFVIAGTALVPLIAWHWFVTKYLDAE